MPIRDYDHLNELRAAMEIEALRRDLAAAVDTALAGKSDEEVSDDELRAAFERVSPDIERRYGVDVWDAVMLAQPSGDTGADGAKKTQHEQEWQSLYGALEGVFIQFGKEDAYGEGDYWIVDDDYGEPSHKVCISRLGFVTPDLVAAIQRALKDTPNWKVLLQIDEPLDGLPDSSSGLTVRHDTVEPHPLSRTRQ
jgi:hypothetical protein